MHGSLFGPESWKPLARALKAYWEGDREAVLVVHADEGEPDPMPISLFFRPPEEMRTVDREAMALARGRVLDVGAGVGAVALVLQERGFSVTAVEVIPEAGEIMRARGVHDVRQVPVGSLSASGIFDTVLLLMNGVALAGTLAGLPKLLGRLKCLLTPGGQIILDSTDLLGSYPEPPATGIWEEGDYPGELQYQMEFQGERGAPFPQLFIDPTTLRTVAAASGLGMDLIWSAESGEYLARLMKVETSGEAIRTD